MLTTDTATEVRTYLATFLHSELDETADTLLVEYLERIHLQDLLVKIYRQERCNIERFEGDDFMFEVSQEEILRCQNVTSSWGGSRYGAFAFTEIGVAMLSGVLNSKVAVEANRRIIRAQLDAISTALAELQAKPSEPKSRKPIGFIQPEDDDDDKQQI